MSVPEDAPSERRADARWVTRTNVAQLRSAQVTPPRSQNSGRKCCFGARVPAELQQFDALGVGSRARAGRPGKPKSCAQPCRSAPEDPLAASLHGKSVRRLRIHRARPQSHWRCGGQRCHGQRPPALVVKSSARPTANIGRARGSGRPHAFFILSKGRVLVADPNLVSGADELIAMFDDKLANWI